MIVNMRRFVENEKEYWEELETVLDRLEKDALKQMNLAELRRFHYLYQRVSSDLAKVSTFSFERETKRYLENLVSRAYAEIHETRERPHRFAPLKWACGTLPRTFRKRAKAFYVSLAVFVVGSMFGALVFGLDPSSKDRLMPQYEHLYMDPSDRVKREETVERDRLQGVKMQGAVWYMTHNTQVAITTMAAGVAYGFATIVMLFYNGVMIGAIGMDYILAGESVFLIGWLLPHGSVEIPALLIAGQAGLILGTALIGWGRRTRLRQRLREIAPDLVTLIGGCALLLVWAGIIEAFFSQYHEPTLPYWLKITFGTIQFILLALFLVLAGRKKPGNEREE